MKRRLWMVIAVFFTVVAFAATGCVGRFAAFNKLSEWNRGVDENEWVNEALFVALVIVPVYEVALLADFVIFNSIEFWSHENPVDQASGDGDRPYQKTATRGTAKIVQSFRGTPGRGSMVTDRYEGGRLVETVVLFRDAQTGDFRGVSATREGQVKVFKIGAGPVLTEYASGTSPRVQVYTKSDLRRVRETMVGLPSPLLTAAR